MTTEPPNTHDTKSDDVPLALRFNEGLGPTPAEARKMAERLDLIASRSERVSTHSLATIAEFLRGTACEIDRLCGEQAVLVRLLVQCDGVLSTLEGESSDEQERLDKLRRAILVATIPHRPEEADLLSVRACIGA